MAHIFPSMEVPGIEDVLHIQLTTNGQTLEMWTKDNGLTRKIYLPRRRIRKINGKIMATIHDLGIGNA